MRNVFKRMYEKYDIWFSSLTLKQRTKFFVVTLMLDVVLGIAAVLVGADLVAELQQPPEYEYETYTFAYAMEHDHSISKTVGQCLDGDYYVSDETMIFGPYSEKPTVQIPIVGSDIMIDMSGRPFAEDLINGFGNGIPDYRGEQRFRLNKDTLVQSGMTRYEDGEIYIYVQFLQKIENLGGSSQSAYRLSDKNTLTDEEQRQADTVVEIQEQGMEDYCLYSPSDLNDVAAGYAATIDYHADHAELITRAHK